MNASKIVVGILDGFADPITSNITAFWIMALGPDGKIYISTGNSTPYLHVINNPDSLGIGCDLCQHCIQLPALNAFTMPNFPNYYLGAEVGSVCDSLTNSVNELHKSISEISVYPNPTNGIFNFTLNSGSSKSILLQIFDTKGEIVYSEKIKDGTNSINLQSLAKGVYFYKLEGEKMVKSGKIVY
jgi:hypothetical protein